MHIFFLLALFFSHITLAGVAPSSACISVSIAEQKLFLKKNNQKLKTYPISTSGYGIGNKLNSNYTPLGKHTICAKIGTNAPAGTIFKGGVQTKRIATIHKKPVPRAEQEDLITTRVLQLQGHEPRNTNSFKRGIWIHGTPYEDDIGTACSHGCIRMRNSDIQELFELITVNTPVIIVEE